MIPKKIHFCWLGGNKKPRFLKKYIRSWKKYCPDYEIFEWNESNLDISSFPLYTRQAYEQKKWAFVTDYIRLWIVYNYGGVYLDTDVELIRPIDDLLKKPSFFGFEDSSFVATGLMFGGEKGNPIIKELMDDYLDRRFIKEDGSLDIAPSPAVNTPIFEKHGIIRNNTYQEIHGLAAVYPTEYFCPLGYYTGELKITENTYSIHHYKGTWQSKAETKKHKNNLKLRKKRGKLNDFKAVKSERGFIYAVLWSIKNNLK